MNNTKLPLSNTDEVKRISEIIECPAEIVRHCILLIGPSIPAIEAYWQMNKDRLLYEVGLLKI